MFIIYPTLINNYTMFIIYPPLLNNYMFIIYPTLINNYTSLSSTLNMYKHTNINTQHSFYIVHH